MKRAVRHRSIIAACVVLIAAGGIVQAFWLQQMHEACSGGRAHQVVCSLSFLSEGAVPLIAAGMVLAILLCVGRRVLVWLHLVPQSAARPQPPPRAPPHAALPLLTCLFRRGILNGRIP